MQSYYMNTKFFAAVALTLGLVACTSNEMKPQKGYIGPSGLEIADGHMTPEFLLSLGRLSDPQLSPDGKTILYGVSYTDITQNRSVRNLFTIPVMGGEPTQLTMDGKSISSARWSNDGNAIFFLQGGQLYKAAYKNGRLGKRTQLTDVEKGIDDYLLSPDTQFLPQQSLLSILGIFVDNFSKFIKIKHILKCYWHLITRLKILVFEKIFPI